MIRVVLTGPESSGKTTLAQALAAELDGIYVAEFARDYLAKLNRPYGKKDLSIIAQGQLASFIPLKNALQIIDSDFVVLKIWSEEKYNEVALSIENLVAKNHFDLHILCRPDIPWEPDELRENPLDRDRLFLRYEEVLLNANKSYIIVSGTVEERIEKSRQEILAISI